jgi:hypothetical protein
MNIQDKPEYESIEHAAESGENLYLARLQEVKAEIIFNDAPLDLLLDGEFLFEGHIQNKGDLTFTGLRYISLWSRPLKELEGLVAFAGPPDEVVFGDGEIKALDLRAHYPLLDKLKPACVESDAVHPVLEMLRGRLSWKMIPSEDETLAVNLTLVLDQPIGDYQALGSLKLDATLPVQLLVSETVAPPSHHSLAPCGSLPDTAPSVPYPQRALHVRFICPQPFPAGENQTTIDDLAQKMIAGACEVWWLKGGIKIEPDSSHVIQDSNLNTTVTVGDEANIPSQVTSAVNNALEVYFVETLQGDDFSTPPQPRRGGGVTYNCGGSTAYMILEIRKARNNPFLLAHEIGHVLGVAHPASVEGQDACGLPPARQGSSCSVMVPDRPTSPRNTVCNIGIASTFPVGPVLTQVFSSGIALNRDCNPDPEQTYFHIVRDFPSDDGTEDSVPPLAGSVWWPQSPVWSVWWTYSDVWVMSRTSPTHRTRVECPAPSHGTEPDELYSDGTPMFNNDRSPQSDQPPRSRPNQFCVRLRVRGLASAVKRPLVPRQSSRETQPWCD